MFNAKCLHFQISNAFVDTNSLIEQYLAPAIGSRTSVAVPHGVSTDICRRNSQLLCFEAYYGECKPVEVACEGLNRLRKTRYRVGVGVLYDDANPQQIGWLGRDLLGCRAESHATAMAF